MNEIIELKSEKNDLELLENFISENEDLEELESIISVFNIFISLNIHNLEIRHSKFLSWLIDPSETHGLGDYFLKILLIRFCKEARSNNIATISVFDVDSWDFQDAEVTTEWRHIDLLIRDDKNKFICIIENKIYSKEHSNQLERYHKIIKSEFPNYKKMFVYLTIDGEPPESEEVEDYIPFSYKEINELIDYVLKNKKRIISREIYIFISHYKEMLRRYIMQDSKIQQLCKNIYKNHKKAIELINEYKPDRLEDIFIMLTDIIKNEGLIIEDSTKSSVKFISQNLDFIPKLGGWTGNIKRIMLFELSNRPEGLNMYLYIGPGNQEIRERLFKIALNNRNLFNMGRQVFTAKWKRLYRKSIIKSKDYQDIDNEELKTKLSEKFQNFIKGDLPKIENEFLQHRKEFENYKSDD